METFERTSPMRLLVLGKIRRISKALATVWTFMWLEIGVHRRHVSFVLRRRFECFLAVCTFVRCFTCMYTCMLFERIFGLHISVTMLTLIRFVMCMCLDVSFEFWFRGECLVVSTFAGGPETAEAVGGVFIEAVDMVLIDVRMKSGRCGKVQVASFRCYRMCPKTDVTIGSDTFAIRRGTGSRCFISRFVFRISK